jgi:hypothetical protein
MLLRMEERNISHRIFFSNWDLKKLRFPAAADVYDEQKIPVIAQTLSKQAPKRRSIVLGFVPSLTTDEKLDDCH